MWKRKHERKAFCAENVTHRIDTHRKYSESPIISSVIMADSVASSGFLWTLELISF